MGMTDLTWIPMDNGNVSVEYRSGDYVILKDRSGYHKPWCLFYKWRTLERYERIHDAQQAAYLHKSDIQD